MTIFVYKGFDNKSSNWKYPPHRKKKFSIDYHGFHIFKVISWMPTEKLELKMSFSQRAIAEINQHQIISP